MFIPVVFPRKSPLQAMLERTLFEAELDAKYAEIERVREKERAKEWEVFHKKMEMLFTVHDAELRSQHHVPDN